MARIRSLALAGPSRGYRSGNRIAG